jgi:hypothetical protein
MRHPDRGDPPNHGLIAIGARDAIELGAPEMRVGTGSPNKELKLTKPSIMELRSLTPVFGRLGSES